MFFLFFALSWEILENTQNLTIEQLDKSNINSRVISNDLFTYSSTGDRIGYPLSNIFDYVGNTYWVAADPSNGNTKSAINIFFKKTISFEQFLISTAYSTKLNGKREYYGHPLKVNVYTSVNHEPLKLHSIFSSEEPTLQSWGDGAQFTFSEPIVCDNLKIEFEKVSFDKYFGTNDETAAVGKLYLRGSLATDNLPFDKVSGVYADDTYVNNNKIPSSSFTYESNGDKDDKPLSNAFDDKFNTWWAASQENSDSFKSAITVTFNSQVTLDAILYDSAFSSDGSKRTFSGFPTVLNVYTESENEALRLNTVFSGTAPTTSSWNRTQFVFKRPITVKKIKIEFAEVTPETFWSGSTKTAAAGGLYFISKIPTFTSANSTLNSGQAIPHRIPVNYFNYSTTGDREGFPISYAFDYLTQVDRKYWIANDLSDGSSTSSIFIDFNKTVSLDTILFDHAFSTSGNNRRYDGFPTKLKIYTSLGNEQLSLKYTFEGNVPTLTSFGARSQFTFNAPILCDHLRIEFVEVSDDRSFTNLKCAVIHEIFLVGDIVPDSLTFTGVSGSYTDQNFLNTYMLGNTRFSSESTGDKDGRPLSNAFDSNPRSYWVSSQENTDSFKNSITINFHSQQNLSAFLFDSAYRSRTDENNKDIRYFDGFPTTLSVFVYNDEVQSFILEAVFSGEPVYPWIRTQFIFKNTIRCNKIKLEFTDVTADGSFSNNKKHAVAAGIYFITESYRMPTIPPVDGTISIPQNKCNAHNRCDVNITVNNIIVIDLQQSSFSNFHSHENGGAISLINCGTLFKSSTFSECTSSKGGGAIFFQNNMQRENELNIEDVTFVNCTAVYGGAAYLYSRMAHVRIINCRFNDLKLQDPPEDYESDVFVGGSALFLSVKNGDFPELTFNGCSDVVVKFYNNFDNKPNSMILSNSKKDLVLFSRCTFKFDKPTKPLFYYVRGNNIDSIVKISDCSFIGEVDKSINFIDGKVIENNSPKLIVESCKFSSDSNQVFKSIDPNVLSIKLNRQIFNFNYSKMKELNNSWKSITAVVAPAALVVVIAIIAAIIFKKKNSNNEDDEDGQNPSEIDQA